LADEISKDQLRRAQRALRRQIAAASARTAAHQAAAHLVLGPLRPFRVVAGYHPIGAEMNPRPLLGRFEDMGADIALPVSLDRETPLIFRLIRGELSADALGVPSPGPEAPEVTPDIVIAPVLAFDRAGGRLGQGAGCYDRTLADLRAAGRVVVIGLAYAGQEVDRVPMQPHDQRLDAILTEKGYIAVRKDI
jgi:5-formyltetrahydrofolate cyclo-ligase